MHLLVTLVTALMGISWENKGNSDIIGEYYEKD